MGSRQVDPRTTLPYKRMTQLVKIIKQQGPQTIDDLCSTLGISYDQFRIMRYSLGGRLALEDAQVVIPRPIVSEGYLYKLSSTYQVGSQNKNGKPNLETASSDVLTRLATIYMDVERLVVQVASGSVQRKLLRKLQKALENTLDRAEDVADAADAPIPPWAQYVLDKVA